MAVSNEDLKGIIDNLTAMVAGVQNTASNIERVNNKFKEDIQGELRIVSARAELLEKQNSRLVNRLEKLEDQMRFLSTKDIAKNVIVSNVKDSEEENADLIETILQVFVRADVSLKREDIECATRLGAEVGSKPRLILVSLKKISDKKLLFVIMKKFKELKIGINNDLSRRQHTERDELKIYKEKLQSIGVASYIRDDRLMCNGKLYGINAVESLLEECSKSVLEDTKKEKISVEPQINIMPATKQPAINAQFKETPSKKRSHENMEKSNKAAKKPKFQAEAKSL